MLRQRLVLFLVLTVVLLGGALLIYGQRTGRLTIFGAIPSTPAKITITSPTDLQKGVAAGNGNTELVDNTIQLKKGTQFSVWTREGATTPDFLGALPAGTHLDFRTYPIATSFSEQQKKYFVTSAGRLHSVDPASGSWQTVSNNIGIWATWSTKRNSLIALQDTGAFNPPTSLGPPSNVITLDASGANPQVVTPNVQFRKEQETALYHDPVSDTIVGFRQLDGIIAGAPNSVNRAPEGFCSTGFETTGCVPTFPQFVEWYDIGSGQDNQFSPPPGSGAPWPEPRVGATAAFDPVTQEILVFGGFTVTPNFTTAKAGGSQTFSHYTFTPASVLWAFNTNSKTWTQRIGANQPPGRAFSKMTYDQKNKRFIVFGGLTGLTKAPATVPAQDSETYTVSNDLWSYDPATNAWQLLSIPNGPGARFGHGLGYNSLDQELLLFGGQGGGTVTQQFGPAIPTVLTDTWTASASGYAQLGTCQFDVGSPQIQQLYRYQAIKPADMPPGTSITVSIAPSTDGVSFGQFSAPITYTSSAATADSIDLSQLLPANTRFIRILCSLSSTGTATPSFGGFTIDYEALGTSTPSFTIDPLIGQAPLTVTATRTDSAAANCTLDFGDGTASTPINASQTLSHVYQTSGTFTATMTCDGQTSTQTVTVTSDPSANVTLTLSKASYAPGELVSFVFQNLGPATITIAETVPFVIRQAVDSAVVFDPVSQVSTAALATNDNRSWTWDQKNQAGSQAPLGTYTVTVPYTIGSQQLSKTATFTLATASEGLTFSVTPTEGVAPLAVTAVYTGTEAGLIWDFGDGTTETVAQGPSTKQHTYQLAGTYTVTLRSGTKLGSQTVLVSSGTTSGNTGTPILVNGSIAGSTTPSTGNVPAPQTLIATGANPAAISLLFAWLVTSSLLFTTKPRRSHRAS